MNRLEDYDVLRERLNSAERLLNTPEIFDFTRAVVLEAQHQRGRWGSDHDSGKQPSDWFWLLGFLAGKALAAHVAGNTEKALHHTISSAAVLANWHAAILGQTNMRPGIELSAESEAQLFGGPAELVETGQGGGGVDGR